MNIKECMREARPRLYKTSFSSIFTLMFLCVLFFNANIFSFSLSTPVQLSEAAVNASARAIVSNEAGQAAATWITSDYDGNFTVQAAT